jgi:hypothetical protein
MRNPNGTFTKGNPGRPKGARNRATSQMREALKALLDEELEALPQMLAELPTEKRLDVLLRLFPYVLPKVEAVSMQAGEPFTWD